MVTIMRIAWSLWILGFFVLALVATSILIFAPSGTPARFNSWVLRLILAAVWPLALFSRAGRNALGAGFRGIRRD